MLAEGRTRAAGPVLLVCLGLACTRTSLRTWPGADGGEATPAKPEPDADGPIDFAQTVPWVERCREQLASAGQGVNGTVRDLAIGDDDTVYLGGDFSWVGPLVGGGVPFTLPEALPPATFARVVGTVFAVAPDGADGWFIGGWFDHVGRLPRKNLAHLGADGDVDAAFQADADDKVSAIAVVGDRVFVGGQFTTLGGVARGGLGLVDFKGSVSAWNPTVTGADTSYRSGSVHALLASNGRLFVGGDFSQVAGADRANLAVFEADGSLGAWHPTVKCSLDLSDQVPVRALASDGNTLWIGGEFDEVAGIAHRAIAAFDASGALRSWDPRFDEQETVAALVAGTNALYVGGQLSSSGASGLAAFDGSGKRLAWHPAVTTSHYGDGLVMALALVGDTLFVGGTFDTVAGLPRAGLAALDTNGKVLDWDPSADGPIRAMAAEPHAIYVGGETRTMCGHERNGLAAVSADGRLLDFNPDVRGGVEAVALRGSTLLFGGDFYSVGGHDHWLLGEVRLSDGQLTELAPTFENGGWVSDIQVLGDAIYIGGGFTSVNHKPANHAAALAPDGSLLPWPSGGPSVGGCFAALDDVLYVGGATGYGGAGEGQLAAFALDRTSLGRAVPADRAVGPLLADEQNHRLYVGGLFREIGGTSRPELAAFGASGELLPWVPTIDPWWIDAMAMLGDDLVVSGVNKLGDSDLEAFLVVLDKDGQPRAWEPSPNSDVRCLAARKGTIYAGGAFTFIDGRYASGFTKLEP